MQIDTHPQPSSSLIDQIQSHLDLPYFWVNFDALGASVREMHRRDIRRSLIEFLTLKLKERNFGNIENLSQALTELLSLSDVTTVPDTSFASISISHCAIIGGFVIAPKPSQVGFDLEIADRISKPSVARISTDTELMSAPDEASLWVAKEAAFKALLGPNQPKVASAITVFEWSQIPSTDLYSFRFFTSESGGLNPTGRGLVATLDCLKMGFARK